MNMQCLLSFIKSKSFQIRLKQAVNITGCKCRYKVKQMANLR